MTSLFFSYAHADEALRDRLELHLAMLQRQGLIDVWHDRRIVPGDPLDDAISAELERADLILLLVSPDFLASSYCYDREMARAMERQAAGEARVLPIILRPCDWHAAPFGKLLATPKDGKPVTKFSDLDEVFLEITNAIKGILAAGKRPTSARSARAPARGTAMGSATSPMAVRSSNLRIKKTFTEADRDRFLEEAFEYIANFFENSLQELHLRNDGIETNFKRIDAHQFTAIAYRDGKAVSRCRIFMGGHAFSGGIAYSSSEWGGGNSFNESLSVGADELGLFLKPLMGSHWGGEKEGRLTFEGGGEHYWATFVAPLQR